MIKPACVKACSLPERLPLAVLAPPSCADGARSGFSSGACPRLFSEPP